MKKSRRVSSGRRKPNTKTSYTFTVSLLKTNPMGLFDVFRKSRHHLDPKFWIELDRTIPNWNLLSLDAYNLVVRARDFYRLRLQLNESIQKSILELENLFPSCTARELALNAGKLFAIGEFKSRDANSKRVVYPSWNLRMQNVLQQISKKFSGHVGTDDKVRAMSMDALWVLNELLLFEYDSLLWNEMMDAWLSGKFEFKQKVKDGQTYDVLVACDEDTENVLALERIRRWYRNQYYWGFSKNEADEDPLIKYAENRFRTTQGFPASIHSGGIMLSEAKGRVSINADDFFEKYGQPNENLSFTEKAMFIGTQAILWHSYYHSLRESYWPSDDVRIREYKVELPGGELYSLYKVFAGIHFLTALSESHFGLIPQAELHRKRLILLNGLQKEPQATSIQDLTLAADNGILNANEIFKFKDYFVEVEESMLFNMLRNFCHYNEEEARKVLRLLTIAGDNTFEFQPLIYAEGKYRWHATVFARKAMARFLFEKHWMKRLFNRRIEGQNSAEVSARADRRAENYNELMSRLFEAQGFKVAVESQTDKVKIDLLAYKDGVLFCIEFKGDNSGIDSFEKRSRWKDNNIGNSTKGLVKQLNERLAFLQTEHGLLYLQNKIGIREASSITRIYPLGVIGTFCFENTIIKLSEDRMARLISYFSLSMILKGTEPAAMDTDTWLNISLRRIVNTGNVAIPDKFKNREDRSEETRDELRKFVHDHRVPFWNMDLTAERLIEMIETNYLWSFVNEHDIRASVLTEELKTQMIMWRH